MYENPKIDLALADVAKGMTVYRAAKVHGISQSSLYSRLARDRTKGILAIRACPCCGRESESGAWDFDALTAKARKVIGRD